MGSFEGKSLCVSDQTGTWEIGREQQFINDIRVFTVTVIQFSLTFIIFMTPNVKVECLALLLVTRIQKVSTSKLDS
jgi:hypothetical protein